MNRAKKIMPVTKKSSSAGHLAGFGAKNWVDHFGPPPRTRLERRGDEENRDVQELKEQVAWIPQIVQDNLAITLTSILPTLVESIANWSVGGRQGPCPIPSMVSSQSNNAAPAIPMNYVFVTPPTRMAAPEALVTPPASTAAPEALVTPPAITAAPELNATDRENTPVAGTAPSSSPSISCTRVVVCGASTLAELDAITVNQIVYRLAIY